uniref:MULE transposase domain-containing protein n=1 Tax=Setaria italica TaxID=4555 RepID=K4AKX6_SETIT
MENVVSIYYGGTVERDEYGCVKFVGMQCEVVIFDEKPSFSELVARAREELHCHENDEITVEGILHLGSPLNIQRKMVPIRCAGQWEKYVRTVMNGHSPSVEVVVRPVGVDRNSRRFSRPMGQRAHFDPPVAEPVMDVDVAPTIPDAESAPNEVVGHGCWIVDDVADSPNGFLFTQNDPINEFSDLSLSDQAFAEGRDDELLEAPEAGPSMVIEEVVCDKERCPWRVCARKQNITGKWKITKVVGQHNCADHELTVRHPQLTSTLIAKRLMGILKEQPNMKVRTIIRTVEEIYGGYVITYGKAWRAKQRAWRMIYGDWESGYEQLPVLFNAIKAVNPGMHYEYIPKPNAWKEDGRQIFGRAFWCFPQSVEAFRLCRPVFSIDGTFLIGKYRGTLLIAISCDANNMLVPLAFALVERENNDSWGWFLRLVRIHVVGPGREVGVISDRHQGILHAVQEQIEGYAPLHHRWCTRHLAENLLRKDGVKDNFDLFQVAARQLEDYYFQR